MDASSLGLPLCLAHERERVQPDGHDAVLTLKAKLLVGLESTVSLVIVVLVTARAVNVLGS